MYCKKIVTKLEHWDANKKRKSSFFIVDVDRGEDSEVFELVGNARVDVHSMWRLLDWQRGEFKDLTLLVSIDLKFVIVANRHELHHIYDSKDYLELELNGDVGVYGTPEGKFVPVIELDMLGNPELADLLGVKVRTAQLQIPTRMSLINVMHGTLDGMETPVSEAYVDPYKAHADALIFAFLAKENWYERVSNVQHQMVDHAVLGHCQTGDWNEGGPLRLYDTKGLTYDELLQRRKRAIRLRNTFWRKFPDPWQFESEGVKEAAGRHFAKLTDDELVELAVVAWYSSRELGAREKSAVIAASARFGAQNDWA